MPSLPLEVLHSVFSYLADPDKTVNACLQDPSDTLVSCSLVCASWRFVCMPFLWRFADLTDPNTTSCEIEFFLQQSRELAEIYSAHPHSSSPFRQTFDYSKYIRGVVIDVSSLCLENETSAAHKQKSESILAILDMIPPVQKLRLEFNYGDTMISMIPQSTSMPNLFAAILKKCEILEYLVLSTRISVNDYFRQLFEAFLNRLTHPLTNFEIHGGFYVRLLGVFQTRAVRSVFLTPHDDSTLMEDLAACIPRWPNLRRLIVSTSSVTYYRFGHIVKSLAESCPRLEVLIIQSPFYDDSITDEPLCHLVDACPTLSDLRLVLPLRVVTDAFLNRCAYGAFNLRYLILPEVGRITCRGITQVPAWRALQTVEIGPANRQLDPGFLDAVLGSCPKLAYKLGNLVSYPDERRH